MRKILFLLRIYCYSYFVRHRMPQFQSSDMVHEARSDWRQSMAPGHESVGTCQTLTDTDGTHVKPNTAVFAHECEFRCLATVKTGAALRRGLRKDEDRRQFGRFCHRCGEWKNSLANFAQVEFFRGEDSQQSDKNWRWSIFCRWSDWHEKFEES